MKRASLIARVAHPTPRILGGLPFAGFKGWAALLFALTSKGAGAQGASFECGSGVSGFSSGWPTLMTDIPSRAIFPQSFERNTQ